MQGHILSCTFCKRSEHQVVKLVAGPGVYICDRCTERAHAIIHEAAPPIAPVSVWQRLAGRFRRFLGADPTRSDFSVWAGGSPLSRQA
jgi:hypothetical protein